MQATGTTARPAFRCTDGAEYARSAQFDHRPQSAADFATSDEIERAVEALGGMVGLLEIGPPKLRNRLFDEVGLAADPRSTHTLPRGFR